MTADFLIECASTASTALLWEVLTSLCQLLEMVNLEPVTAGQLCKILRFGMTDSTLQVPTLLVCQKILARHGLEEPRSAALLSTYDLMPDDLIASAEAFKVQPLAAPLLALTAAGLVKRVSLLPDLEPVLCLYRCPPIFLKEAPYFREYLYLVKELSLKVQDDSAQSALVADVFKSIVPLLVSSFLIPGLCGRATGGKLQPGAGHPCEPAAPAGGPTGCGL